MNEWVTYDRSQLLNTSPPPLPQNASDRDLLASHILLQEGTSYRRATFEELNAGMPIADPPTARDASNKTKNLTEGDIADWAATILTTLSILNIDELDLDDAKQLTWTRNVLGTHAPCPDLAYIALLFSTAAHPVPMINTEDQVWDHVYGQYLARCVAAALVVARGVLSTAELSTLPKAYPDANRRLHLGNFSSVGQSGRPDRQLGNLVDNTMYLTVELKRLKSTSSNEAAGGPSVDCLKYVHTWITESGGTVTFSAPPGIAFGVVGNIINLYPNNAVRKTQHIVGQVPHAPNSCCFSNPDHCHH